MGGVSVLPALIIAAVATGWSPPFELRDCPRLDGYHVKRWGTDDGLPQNSVNAIAQNSRGELVLATFGGVAIFDGRAFRTITLADGLPSPRVTRLAADPRGRIWLGFESGGVAAWTESGIEVPPQPTTLAQSTIHSLLAANGRVWAGDGRRVWTEDGGWTSFNAGSFQRLDPGAHGLWISGPDGSAYLSDGVLALDPEKRVAVHEGRHGTWRYLIDTVVFASEQNSQSLLRWGSPPPLTVTDHAVDASGALWVGMNRLLVRWGPEALAEIHAGEARIPPEVYEMPTRVTDILNLGDDVVWVGTDGCGLWRFTPRSFRNLRTSERALQPVTGLLTRASGYLMTSHCGGVQTLSAAGARPQHLADHCLGALFEDGGGTLWFGGKELWSLRDGTLTPHPLPGDRIRVIAIEQDADGALWVSSRHGHVFRRGRRESSFRRVLEEVVYSLTRNGESVLLGADGAVLEAREGRVVRRWSAQDGIPPGAVRAVRRDASGMWVGTYGGGVARLDPSGVVWLDQRSGLADDFISAVVTDGRGRVWFNSNRGAFYIKTKEIEALRNGSATTVTSHRLGTPEAMLADPSYQLDGARLAFPTVESVVEIDLDAELLDASAPKVWLESVVADNTTPVPPKRTLTLPAERRSLEAHFSGAFLGRSGVGRFEYRLVGLSPQWRPGRSPLRFEALNPGSYRLEVRARNGDGIPSQVVRRPFRLEPTLYERGSLHALAGVILLAFGWLVQATRTRRVRRKNLELRAELDERKQTEEALSRREAQYRSIFHSATSAFLVIDRDAIVVDANAGVAALLGTTRDELEGISIRHLPGQASLPWPLPDDRRGGLIRCVTKAGRPLWARAELSSLPIGDDHGHLLTLQGTARTVRSGVILYFDDDPGLWKITRAALTAAGYEVLGSTDPRELDALWPSVERVSLLLLDVNMPHASGPELAARVHEARPDLPVLFVSGDTQDLLLNLLPGQDLLEKPYRLAQLIQRIESMMKSATRRRPSTTGSPA